MGQRSKVEQQLSARLNSALFAYERLVMAQLGALRELADDLQVELLSQVLFAIPEGSAGVTALSRGTRDHLLCVGRERVGVFGGSEQVAEDRAVTNQAQRASRSALIRIIGDIVSKDGRSDDIDDDAGVCSSQSIVASVRSAMKRLIRSVGELSDREALALTLHFGNIGERVLAARFDKAIKNGERFRSRAVPRMEARREQTQLFEQAIDHDGRRNRIEIVGAQDDRCATQIEERV